MAIKATVILLGVCLLAARAAQGIPHDRLRGAATDLEEVSSRNEMRDLICENCMGELQHQVLGLRCSTKFYDEACAQELIGNIKQRYCPRCRIKVDPARYPVAPMSNCLPCTYSCVQEGEGFKVHFKRFWVGMPRETAEGFLSEGDPWQCCREPAKTTFDQIIDKTDYAQNLRDFIKECEAFNPTPADEFHQVVPVPVTSADRCMDKRSVFVSRNLVEAKESAASCSGGFHSVDFTGWGEFTQPDTTRPSEEMSAVQEACQRCTLGAMRLKQLIQKGAVSAEEVVAHENGGERDLKAVRDCMVECQRDCVPLKAWYGGDPKDKFFTTTHKESARVAWVQAHMLVAKRGLPCEE